MPKLFKGALLMTSLLLVSCGGNGGESDTKSNTSTGLTKPITSSPAAKSAGATAGSTISSSANVSKGLEHLENNDASSAAKEFSNAFDAGDADGAFYLGRMSELGIGLKPDLTRAVALYKAGAEKGSSLSKNRLGLMHLSGQGALQDFELGAKLICEAADGGDANAQFNCGNLHLQGKGVTKDKKTAVSYFEKASEQNHIAAQNFLGLAHLKGEGVQVSSKKANEQFQRTADAGNPLGMFQLAEYFADADNEGHKDLEKSHMYFNLAASNGHPGAAARRDEVQAQMTPEALVRAQKMAREWTAKVE